jgi:hypothetical protein
MRHVNSAHLHTRQTEISLKQIEEKKFIKTFSYHLKHFLKASGTLMRFQNVESCSRISTPKQTLVLQHYITHYCSFVPADTIEVQFGVFNHLFPWKLLSVVMGSTSP